MINLDNFNDFTTTTMEFVKFESNYVLQANENYDYLGESVRIDIEKLIELSDHNFTVQFVITYSEKYENNELMCLVPKNTPYDYIGESLRDEIEDKYDVGMKINMKVYCC